MLLLATILAGAEVSVAASGARTFDGRNLEKAYESLLALQSAFHDTSMPASEIKNRAEAVLIELSRARPLVTEDPEFAFIAAAGDGARNARVLAEELDEPSNFADDPDRKRSRDVLAALILRIDDRLKEGIGLFEGRAPSKTHYAEISCLSDDAEAEAPARILSAIELYDDEVESCRAIENVYAWGTVGHDKFFANESDRNEFVGFLAEVVGSDFFVVKERGPDMVIGVSYRCAE